MWRLVSAAAIIGFGVSRIELGGVWDVLLKTSPPLAALSFVLLLAGQAVSGLRWSTIAHRLGSVTETGWFVLTYLRCCFYNVFLPTGIGGDAVRVAALRNEVGLRESGRSVVLDRATGLLALCVTGALLLPWTPYLDTVPFAQIAACVLGIVALLTVMVIATRGDWLPLVVTTVAFEVLWCGGIWVLARALRIDLPVAALPAITVIVALAIALPVSLGGNGTREAGFVAALAPLGFATHDAVALGIAFGAVLAIVGLCGAPLPIRTLVK